METSTPNVVDALLLTASGVFIALWILVLIGGFYFVGLLIHETIINLIKEIRSEKLH